MESFQVHGIAHIMNLRLFFNLYPIFDDLKFVRKRGSSARFSNRQQMAMRIEKGTEVHNLSNFSDLKVFYEPFKTFMNLF